MDTDAAGIWHYTAALRFIEHAEHELFGSLGFGWIAGHAPRVRVELDFVSPVSFGDEVETTVTVEDVGRTSFTLDAVLRGPSGVVGRGRIVGVLVESIGGTARQIPEELRSALGAQWLPCLAAPSPDPEETR